MNPEIFREYDIRGIAGKDMTEEEVFLLGKGIGDVFTTARLHPFKRRKRLPGHLRGLRQTNNKRSGGHRL